MTRAPSDAGMVDDPMADRPILFSAPMVRALLDGRKTQTRRVLKPQPFGDVIRYGWDQESGASWTDQNFESRALPFWAGDRLWVRERWSHSGVGVWTIGSARMAGRGGVFYAADGGHEGAKYWPSIHMPREFSRLTLIVEDVKVERLQEISEDDARAEGATMRLECSGFQGRDPGWSMDWSRVGQPSRWAAKGGVLSERDVSLDSARSAFASFINELHDPQWNLKGDGIFGANPWVAAITFRIVKQNIDALERNPARSAGIKVVEVRG